ncbi:hypothetical protein C8A01DRAFT_34360 [Parachaetomium inaequale]|uniref:FAD-binding domain-containing protein n=1 Tax=Parachaetomium inaequale TaxID=2588326 RepID=A0AAN6PNB5_9PEZI|nr:hypothetical protein C8A01DRAFT_34360 [Parachaetomium inaequale]
MASNFKVIIVGGGPVGLTAAHALHQAGIDFVVLERRETLFNDEGASLVVSPPTLRLMHQLGLLSSVRSIGADIQRVKSFDLAGHRFAHHLGIFDAMKKNHGAAPMAFHRAELVEAFHHGLPADAKAKVLTGKKIVDMASDDAGVRVTCADGTAYSGSLILGADGVHSQTRRFMRRLALAADPTADWEPEEPFPAEYRCMWCSFPRPGEAGLGTDTQHKDRSTMYLSGKDRAWIFLYEKLPEKTAQRARYTGKDIEEYAAKFADFPIDDKLYVRDVFDKSTAGMANLEEGVAKHWSWGRMVLVGDACHKVTPNAGRGYNNGAQDVVALANRLQGALRSSADGTLDNATLAGLFDDYQRTRTEAMQSDASISAHVTRLHAWSNTLYYIFARHIAPWGFVQRYIQNQLSAPQIAKSLILDYVPAEEPLKGSVPWEHPMPSVPLSNKV